jgi:hypothetical protein
VRGSDATAEGEHEEWRRAGSEAHMRGWWPEAVRGGALVADGAGAAVGRVRV